MARRPSRLFPQMWLLLHHGSLIEALSLQGMGRSIHASRPWLSPFAPLRPVVPIGLTPNDPMGELGGTARAPLPTISCVLRSQPDRQNVTLPARDRRFTRPAHACL